MDGRTPLQKPSWLERIACLRNVGPFLKIIWQTSPLLTAAIMALRLCRAVLPLGFLWISKLILDLLVELIEHRQGDVHMLWRLILVEFALAVTSDTVSRLDTLFDSLLGDKFTNLLSIRLIRHASTLDLASFEDPAFYDKLENARGQTTKRLALFASFLDLTQQALTLACLSVGLIVFSPWVMILLTLTVIPMFISDSHFSMLGYSALFRLTPWRRQLEYLRSLGASAHSAKEVKLYGLGDYLANRYKRVSSHVEDENKKLSVKRVIMGSLLNIASTSAYYVAYATIMWKALASALSIGTFTFFAGAFYRCRSAVQSISNNLANIAEHALFLSDLFDVFQMRPSIRSAPNPVPVPRPIREGFEFRNVSFVYPGSNHLVVRNVSFRLAPGERIALVGENGAGKTTIAKLLGRLYDPNSGKIFLDGVDLREYDLDDLHHQIGVIFQDFLRYDMSARENIGFGDIEFLDDIGRIKKAAYESEADEFISLLPRAYDQMMGRRFEDGVDLSGGQWQKIALARAYMRDAQVVVLDEPTANLDPRSEYKVFQHFLNLMRNRACLLISHRFSTVRMANHILVLADGEIKEQGTHEELMAMDGGYAELFGLQAAGYR